MHWQHCMCIVIMNPLFACGYWLYTDPVTSWAAAVVLCVGWLRCVNSLHSLGPLVVRVIPPAPSLKAVLIMWVRHFRSQSASVIDLWFSFFAGMLPSIPTTPTVTKCDVKTALCIPMCSPKSFTGSLLGESWAHFIWRYPFYEICVKCNQKTVIVLNDRCHSTPNNVKTILQRSQDWCSNKVHWGDDLRSLYGLI